MKSTVHLVQLDCVWENKHANFEKVVRLLEDARPAEGSLIVLPEMFATGFSLDTSATRQGPDRESDAFLRALAMKHKCCVVGGVVSETAAGGCHNEAVVFGADGSEIARYAKIQPFKLGGEADIHHAGDEVLVFDWAGFKVAPLVCYDLRFPELAREAVLTRGAEVLIYIASWPSRRYQHWLTLLEARAIENQAYVIGVNRCGNDPQLAYAGRSVVVDPHGVIIADAGAREQVMAAPVSRAILTEWRAEFPALADAMPPGAR